jgi:predicted nucleotidyltransferase
VQSYIILFTSRATQKYEAWAMKHHCAKLKKEYNQNTPDIFFLMFQLVSSYIWICSFMHNKQEQKFLTKGPYHFNAQTFKANLKKIIYVLRIHISLDLFQETSTSTNEIIK